jgi:hypothetical protein
MFNADFNVKLLILLVKVPGLILAGAVTYLLLLHIWYVLVIPLVTYITIKHSSLIEWIASHKDYNNKREITYRIILEWIISFFCELLVFFAGFSLTKFFIYLFEQL